MLIGRIKKLCVSLVSLTLVGLAVWCVGLRASGFVTNENTALMAAAMTMSKGNITAKSPTEATEKAKEQTPKEKKQVINVEKTSTTFSSDYYNSEADHGDAVKYPVYSRTIDDGGESYDNFMVRNTTSFPFDIGSELNSKLGFKLEKSDDVQVLIYHTHTSESYLDRDVGYYYSDYYPRTSDERYNVTQVGEAIAEQLRQAGIGVIHDTTVHDTTYNGSYDRSIVTVNSYIKKYPKIKVTLDIHRDSIGADDYKVKPTFTYNGKKGAQIMIMSGYDEDGSYGFPDWEKNLRFALKLQKNCEDNFPQMTRPLNFGDFVYNMNVNTGSLLIEVGTDSNTLDEAVYSGNLLGKALAQVLQNNI